ncbi:hypothetical protein OWR29_32010 [Actinoplanes sp. Pm04-4]|uniref:Uncharacterized protein n=1 Tax=Paractinoplanes pyxinae TaxID=2997416 RepID=A0ABT4B9W6_9ACTN|nr:hypothetical protein [Actinoplanes pyxinae]MCY1142645.1 hypothetical protein [Actinoplanes pyxinae]
MEDAVHEDGHTSEKSSAVQSIDILATFLEDALRGKKPWSHDLTVFRRLLNEALQKTTDGAIAEDQRQVLLELANDLRNLDSLLNDFTGQDLRQAKLERHRLAGMRWDGQTRWPKSWQRRIAENSDEVAPGVFVVREDFPPSGGHS